MGILQRALLELEMLMRRRSVILLTGLFLVFSGLLAFVEAGSTEEVQQGWEATQQFDMAASLGTAFLAYAVPFVAGLSLAQQMSDGIAKPLYMAYPRFHYRLGLMALAVTLWAWGILLMGYALGGLMFWLVQPTGVLHHVAWRAIVVSLLGRMCGYLMLALLGVAVGEICKRVSMTAIVLMSLFFILPLGIQMLRMVLAPAVYTMSYLPMSVFNAVAEMGVYRSVHGTLLMRMSVAMCGWMFIPLGFAAWQLARKDMR